MEINSRNYTQAFTGFKLTNKTRQGAIKLLNDITEDHKELQPEHFKQYQQLAAKCLQDEFIEPLKKMRSEVEYDDGRIFVRSADKIRSVEIDRKRIPGYTIDGSSLQYPVIGEQKHVNVNYKTYKKAEEMANDLAYYESFRDLTMAKEIAKHFDLTEVRKLTAETARSAYQKELDTIADEILGSL